MNMKDIFKFGIKTDRIYGLDILRCFAILFVVASHGNNLLPFMDCEILSYLIFDGVSIFFVLSGYLIGGILIKLLDKNKLTFTILVGFWKKRWLRTLPVYFLVLTVLVSLNLIVKHSFSFAYLKYYIFSQNLFSAHPYFFPEAWSLSIEEWFYLILPILLVFFINILNFSTKHSFLILTLTIIATINLFRFYLYTNLEVSSLNDWDLLFRKQVSTRLDSLMFGVFGSYLSFYHQRLWERQKQFYFIIGLVILFFVQFRTFNISSFDLYECVFSFSTASIGTLLLLPYLCSIKTGSGFLFKCCTLISLISYSMYLINLTLVQDWILKLFDLISGFKNDGHFYYGVRYLLYWICTISLAFLMYKFFELPIMKLRKDE